MNKWTLPTIRICCGLIISAFFTFSSANAKPPRITMSGNVIQIKSDLGNFVLFADPDLDKYRFYTFEIDTSEIDEESAVPVPDKEEQVPKEDENDVTDLLNTANFYYNKRQFETALVFVERALSMNLKSAEAWKMRGSIMFVQKKYKLAKKYWKQALKLDPNNIEVQEHLKRLK